MSDPSCAHSAADANGLPRSRLAIALCMTAPIKAPTTAAAVTSSRFSGERPMQRLGQFGLGAEQPTQGSCLHGGVGQSKS
jgi:hypothetical protein